MFTPEEFEAPVLEGARGLLDIGFVHSETTSFSVVLRRGAVRVIVTQDRGGEISFQVQKVGVEDAIYKQELQRFLDWPAQSSSFCRELDSIPSVVTGFIESLLADCLDLLEGRSNSWEALQEWVAVDRILNTQSRSAHARPAEKWNLIMGAWNGKRFRNLEKLLKSLPEPHTEAEEIAMSFCSVNG